MRILNLTVKGFRSLKDISWAPGDLSVIIGPNGTGKSNLLRLLELISASARGGLGKYVQRSGGMEPLVWDGVLDALSFSVRMPPVDPGRDRVRDSLTYELELRRVGRSGSFVVGHELLANYYKVETKQSNEPFKLIERDGRRAVVFDAQLARFTVPEESVSDEETLLSIAAGPFTYNRLIPPVQKELSGVSVYHDWHVDRDAPVRQPVIARREERVDPDGQNLIQVLHTLYTGNRKFKKDIDEAMKAAFGNDYEELLFPPAADQRIQLRLRWRTLQREQSAADLSDGTLRFLFLLTVLASPSAAPVIAIDEPETGLHPSMLPIIAEYAAEAARKSQVMLTTHSPQVLDAFGPTRPTTTVASWADGESALKVLSGEELDYWLRQYSLGALFTSGELESME